jgi:hypothetical protein
VTKVKGLRKNKFTFSGAEAPVWQGAEAREYRDISALWQHCQAGCIGASKCKVIFAWALRDSACFAQEDRAKKLLMRRQYLKPNT